MKKLLKPACLGFYILMLVSCFFVGVYFADLVEAAKNQGLAGGAIVLGYGVLFGGIGFVASFFLAYFLKIRTIKIINWILLIGVITTVGYLVYRYQERKKEKTETEEQQQRTTVPAETAPTSALFRMGKKPKRLASKSEAIQQNIGMGFYKPRIFGIEALYFYGNPNLEKSILEHSPTDSITFREGPAGVPGIGTAPPYFVPAHMKLDYGIMFLKVISITDDFVEIEINNQTAQTTYVDKRAGEILHWPDFLLRVNSVEFREGSKEKVHLKWFEKSAVISEEFDFMAPLRIRGDWMQVMLVTDNYESRGKGWIRWKKDGKLLITYNLLS